MSVMNRTVKDGVSGPMIFVRYGAMGTAAPFSGDPECLGRDDKVVVRSPRGIELGRVLAVTEQFDGEVAGTFLRLATPHDLEWAECAAARRSALYEAVRAHAHRRHWPIAVLDVEEIFEQRAVAYYLGAPVVEDRIGMAFGGSKLDLLMESAAVDPRANDTLNLSGRRGSGGCGTCGDRSVEHTSSPTIGCSGCAVAALLAARG